MNINVAQYYFRSISVFHIFALGAGLVVAVFLFIAPSDRHAHGTVAPALLSLSPTSLLALGRLDVVDLQGRRGNAPLRSKEAKYLLLDHNVSSKDALKLFFSGQGQYFNDAELLGGRSPADMGKSLFVIFTYRTGNKNTVLVRYRAMGISSMNTWVEGLNSNGEFSLVGRSGSDIVGSERRRWLPDFVPDSLIPAAVLPGTDGEVYTAFMRLDAAVPYYPVVRVLERAAFEYENRERSYLRGLFVGATLIAVVMALIGTVRRRSLDFALFLFCILILGFWSSVKSEATPVFDFVAWRRFSVGGLMFLYFFANTLATRRLLKRPDVSLDKALRLRRVIPPWQAWPMFLSLLINVVGLILAIVSSVLGDYAKGVGYIELAMMVSSGCTPFLLLIASWHAMLKNVQGAAIMLGAQLLAALGFVLNLVRAFTTILDEPIFGVVTAYSLPLEALVWAIALAARYEYLDFLAKEKIDGALKDEAQRVRAEAAEAGRARDEAYERERESLRGLRSSYDALYGIQKGVYAMSVMTHHDMKNAIDKVRMAIEELAIDKLLPEAGKLLKNEVDNLGEGMEKVNQATRALLSSEAYHAAAVGGIVSRLLEFMSVQMQQRGLRVLIELDSIATAMVDEYPCHAVINELLVNAVRYALPDSTVSISGRLILDEVVIRFRTESDISAERKRLLIQEKVAPDTPQTGERSSGTGLYNLRRVLEPAGASISVDRSDMDGLTIVLRLPMR